MKNVILIALICAGHIFTATAQVTPTTPNNSTNPDRPAMSEYERMLQNESKVDFRTQADKVLGLTAQQIKDFDPLFSKYMEKKNELAQKRIKLYNEYVEEVAENESPANEENDKEEFLEDYIELQVKEMELRKEYFDKMEDVITADKAFGFYLIEDMAANDVYLQILEVKFAPFVAQQREGHSSTRPSYDSQGKMTNPDKGNMNNNPSMAPSSNDPSKSTTNPGTTNPSNMDRNNTATGTEPSKSTTNPSTTNPSNMDRNNTATGTDPSKATGKTSPNAPSPTTKMPGSSADSLKNDRTMTMPSDATKGNMNNGAKTMDSRYKSDIDKYSNWSKTTKGDVGANHQYTRDGLNNLAAAISSLSSACGMTADNVQAANKKKIMDNAAELQKDPSSMKHSSLMRESFIMAADMLKSVQQKCSPTSNSTAVTQMAEAAKKIDVNKTTNSQQQHITDFFQKAQFAIDGMASGMKWSDK